MPRCKCQEVCFCSLELDADETCLSLTGAGTGDDPYTLLGVIDPDVANEVECRPNGLWMGRDDNVADTDCIDLTTVEQPGIASKILTADFIISPDACNVLECLPPGDDPDIDSAGLWARPGPQEWCWCLTPASPDGQLIGPGEVEMLGPEPDEETEDNGLRFTIIEPGCYRLILKGEVYLAWTPNQAPGTVGASVQVGISPVSPFDNCLFVDPEFGEYIYQYAVCDPAAWRTLYRIGGVLAPDETQHIPFMASFDYTITDALAPTVIQPRIVVGNIGTGPTDLRVTGGTAKVIMGSPPAHQLGDNNCSSCYGYSKTGTFYSVPNTTTTASTTTTTTGGAGLFLNMGEAGINPGWVMRCDPGTGTVIVPRRYDWGTQAFNGEAMTSDPVAGLLYHIGGGGGGPLMSVDPNTLATGSVAIGPPTGPPLGMAWDGTDVWLSDANAILYSITLAGAVTTVGTMDERMPGIEWIGATLWAVNRDCSLLYEIDSSDGSTLATTPITFVSGPQTPDFAHGLAYDGADLYISYALPETGFGNYRRRLGVIDTSNGELADVGQFTNAGNPGGWQVSDLAFL
ncbi:MAG TPA: hypothetical protein VMW08_00165 [Acidimicrobiales bacterium]|nr:hypothetical protein [Acidimicrobiales bacterium]